MHFSQVRKVLVAELAPPHAQSAWGFRRERVRAAGLAADCNYLSKKRKLIYVSKNEPINVLQNCRIHKTHRVNALRQIPNAWYKFKVLKTD